ncbi:hypothetical protein [Delftia sp. WSY_22]|uniref:hypothetical protein n=1 Tax=Delftia sp. WSY_22 TaxID=3367213 RepID=UPI00370CBEFA
MTRLLGGGLRKLGQRISPIDLVQGHGQAAPEREIDQPQGNVHRHGLQPGLVVGDVSLAAFDSNAKLFLGHTQERPYGFECLHDIIISGAGSSVNQRR